MSQVLCEGLDSHTWVWFCFHSSGNTILQCNGLFINNRKGQCGKGLGKKNRKVPQGPEEGRWGWGFSWAKGYPQLVGIQNTNSKDSLLSKHLDLRLRWRLTDTKENTGWPSD